MDTSVRTPNGYGQRIADALLRVTAGTVATLLVPPAIGDNTDAGQLGINPPQLQQLPLAPAVFRRTRATLAEGEEPRYELLISASAVQEQVSTLQLESADGLFLMAAGVLVGGGEFCIEGWSSSLTLGQACLYRLSLRGAEPQSLTSLILSGE
jgi:hypothetical protein